MPRDRLAKSLERRAQLALAKARRSEYLELIRLERQRKDGVSLTYEACRSRAKWRLTLEFPDEIKALRERLR